MNKHELIHELYLTNQLPNLTLDDMLLTANLTHLKHRRWLHKHNHTLYKPTPGLRKEVLDSSMSRTEAARIFNISLLEINQCLYAAKSSRDTSLLRSTADSQRNAGTTELSILEQGLPPDMARLSDEITARRKDGESISHLATLYGYTQGRISQLDKHSNPKPRLTDKAKQEIRASPLSAQSLAKKYNTTVNTIYVTQREK